MNMGQFWVFLKADEFSKLLLKEMDFRINFRRFDHFVNLYLTEVDFSLIKALENRVHI